MAYASTAQLQSWLRITDPVEDPELAIVLDQAKQDIDAHCGRSFDKATGTPSDRVFAARWFDKLYVDDIANTIGLVIAVDTGRDGTFSQTWAAADYQLEPLNQRQAGMSNHPYYVIRAIESKTFPVSARAQVKVTADWGWTTLPKALETASLMHAGRLHSRRINAAGVAEGAAFPTRVTMAMDRDTLSILEPFVRVDRLVAA
ncbi:MAG: phage gp6-like head-tail connector protein [Gammaproteobacteria bacterium]|nr:phage gp6-like head-tail connector protein [Gammaproteobacteria bacterium]